MNRPLVGKVAMVTGASRGIGIPVNGYLSFIFFLCHCQGGKDSRRNRKILI